MVNIIQLALDISLNTSYRWENFYISPSNESVVMLVQNWPHWSNRVQLIYGQQHCGKTHIAHLWAQKSRAIFMNNDSLNLDFLSTQITNNPFVIIDDADKITNFKGMFHLYNLINEHQGYLLLTSSSPVTHWSVPIPDLVSRLRSIPATEIISPDDELLYALLVKRFSDLQIKASGPVLAYIAKHVERSYRGIYSLCNKINQLSLERKKEITIPLVKQALA